MPLALGGRSGRRQGPTLPSGEVRNDAEWCSDAEFATGSCAWCACSRSFRYERGRSERGAAACVGVEASTAALGCRSSSSGDRSRLSWQRRGPIGARACWIWRDSGSTVVGCRRDRDIRGFGTGAGGIGVFRHGSSARAHVWTGCSRDRAVAHLKPRHGGFVHELAHVDLGACD